MVLRGERVGDNPDLLDNLQAWDENDYDSRVLHSNLAFPLLRELVKVGDIKAGKIFKEEVIRRIEAGNINVIKYLMLNQYLENFSREELETFYNSTKYRLGKIAVWGYQNKAPRAFFQNLEKLTDVFELSKLGVKNNAPETFFKNIETLSKNVNLTKMGLFNNAPILFYIYFHKIKEDIDFAEWCLHHNAPNDIYVYFNIFRLPENRELIKWCIKSKISERKEGGMFYTRREGFYKLKEIFDSWPESKRREFLSKIQLLQEHDEDIYHEKLQNFKDSIPPYAGSGIHINIDILYQNIKNILTDIPDYIHDISFQDLIEKSHFTISTGRSFFGYKYSDLKIKEAVSLIIGDLILDGIIDVTIREDKVIFRDELKEPLDVMDLS